MKATQTKMTLDYCKLGTVDGPWRYDASTRQIFYNTGSEEELCLGANSKTNKVHLESCDAELDTQQWIWKKIKPRL